MDLRFQSRQDLISFLKSAKEVEILSNKIEENWVMDLLSSSTDLERLATPLLQRKTPNSRNLELIALRELSFPRNLYHFKDLKIPDVQVHNLRECACPSLSSNPIPSLVELSVRDILVGTLSGYNEEAHALNFLSVVGKWKTLKSLKIQSLPDDETASLKFFEYFISALTPLSSDSLSMGYESSILFPSLRRLELGMDPELAPLSTAQEVKRHMSKALVNLVSAKKAAFEKRSASEILLASHGLPLENQDLQDSTMKTTNQGEQPNFKCEFPIQSFKILVDLKRNPESCQWSKEYVEEVDLSGLEYEAPEE